MTELTELEVTAKPIAMLTEDRKELELRAYGKRISFHTRHWWLLEWIESQPGTTISDKVWNIVNGAYRSHYAQVGRDNFFKALQCWGSVECVQYLCTAKEAFDRAGDSENSDKIHATLWSSDLQKAMAEVMRSGGGEAGET